VQEWHGMRNGAMDGKDLDDAAVLEAAVRRGIAVMMDGALISLIADRRDEDPAVVEAAIRELEQRNRKTGCRSSAHEN